MKNLYNRAVNCCLFSLFIIILLSGTAASAQESMRANLYAVNGSNLLLIDGNLTDYNSGYSNEIDIHDAWKLTNPGINFGIFRSGINLVIERRSLYRKTDTTYFRMWNMPKSEYCIKFILKKLDHPGMKGFLFDRYLNNFTPVKLNDTTLYNFKINTEMASADEMRFQLIYAPDPVLASMDVLFEQFKAHRDGGNILVDWTVDNELFVDYYTVEYSIDGYHFAELQQIISENSKLSKSYSCIDPREKGKVNYYRIRADGMTGKVTYSNKFRLDETAVKADVNVFPNPVVDHKIRMSVNNLPDGKYALSLVSGNGAQVFLPDMQISKSDVEKLVNIPQFLSPGLYRLVITGLNNIKIVKTINVL